MSYEVQNIKKKPLACRVIKFDGSLQCFQYIKAEFKCEGEYFPHGLMTVRTPEGTLQADIGDFIIEERPKICTVRKQERMWDDYNGV